MDQKTKCGTLYIVATPIGNLGDMTFRAVETLKNADLIAAEDTRHSKKLLNHYGITAKSISCHEHNEEKKIPRLIQALLSGKNIALISDAGTPTISDPGYRLVAQAAKENIPVIPIPGCSAAIAGLSVSGLPTDTFLFVGFLSKKKKKQQIILEQLKDQAATLILYESPKRIQRLIQNCIEVFGDQPACLAREITKRYEEYLRGPLSFILKSLAQRDIVKGECVLYVQGRTKKEAISEETLQNLIKNHMEAGELKTKELARKISNEYGLSTKKVYDLILHLQTGKSS